MCNKTSNSCLLMRTLFLHQEQLLHSPPTLGLEQVLSSWTMSTAMEMKQTSLSVDTMGLEFMTVYTVKMLGFSAVVVSQFTGCSL